MSGPCRMGERKGGRRPRRRRAGACVAALALLGLQAACGERPRDLVLISIDTLRADRLGSYGREGAGTPQLDRLARRGARFSDAMAPAPITLPSHASLLTGLDPSRHGVRHNGLYALDARATTLAERLRSEGFRTGAFVGSIALAAWHGLDQGFERYTQPGRGESPRLFFLGERPAERVNRDALAWLDELGPSEPVFLFVHYMEPHAPFEPPEPELSRFEGDRYQGEVATSDRAVGELLAGLAARGRLRRALVTVVGDHGESLGEHGELSHGIFVYQSTLHVPLILAGPAVPSGRVVDEPVSLIDVMPTLLDAVGLAGDSGGRSLLPALRGHELGPRGLYGETFAPRLDFGWSELRVWRRGAEKWIDAPRPELYDLGRDPQEQVDLAADEPEAVRRFAAELAAHLAGADDASRRIELPDSAREALASLGYLSGAHEGDAAPSRADPKDHVADAVALERATRFGQHGRLDDAIAELRDLIRRQPSLFDARLRLSALLALAGRGDEAIAEARALVEVADRAPHGDRVAGRAHLLLANLYVRAGQLEPAARSYERALEMPQPASVRRELDAVYRELGRSSADGAGGPPAPGDAPEEAEGADPPMR